MSVQKYIIQKSAFDHWSENNTNCDPPRPQKGSERHCCNLLADPSWETEALHQIGTVPFAELLLKKIKTNHPGLSFIYTVKQKDKDMAHTYMDT